MAGKDLSKTFSEFESEDISLETSVPTDITYSPSSDDLKYSKGKRDHKSDLTKQLLERKQMQHDLQVLKIELSQKALLLDNQKSQYQQGMEELEEKLNDALHQKQMMQVRLESELKIQGEENQRRTLAIRKQLEELTLKQKQLEDTNKDLAKKAGSVRDDLRDLSLSSIEYNHLRSCKKDDLSLRDFIRVTFYKTLHPLQTELQDVRLKISTLEEENKQLTDKILVQQKDLVDEKQRHSDLLLQYQKLIQSAADTKKLIKTGDFKLENYDKLKANYDTLEREHLDLQRQLATLEASYGVLQSSRDDLATELSASKQSLCLYKQDKEYLSQQVLDVQNRCSHGNEKILQITAHLEEAKKAREDMYEKYVSCRDQYKSEYETKLREELEALKMRTAAEIDKLRVTSQEMYERENRSLREARDLAISEKDRSQQTERELNAKYEQLLTTYRQQQSDVDTQVSDTNSQLKLKSFECERTQMVYEEMVTKNKKAILEVEKLQTKFEVLTKEYYAMQSSYEKRIAELECEKNEKNVKIESYEKMENELDDIVLQAAEVESSEDAENVLFSYGYGANVPSTAKRRMQQSVHLAQRVLHLEKSNTTLQKEIENEKQRSEQITQELQNANELLGQSQQPYNYLINTIRIKDQEISRQKEGMATLQSQVKHLESENKKLTNVKNQMSLDIEKLLNQSQEISVMKQAILNLKSGTTEPHSALPPPPEVNQEPRAIEPPPMQFTKEMPKWYKKLHHKPPPQSSANYPTSRYTPVS